MKRKSSLNIRSMALCALFAALSAAGAFIRIPIGLVPVTLQLLFTNLSGLLLGKKLGAISVAVYVFLGLVGLPVFTGGGGLSYVLYPTFGYLLGMILGAYATGTVAEKGGGRMGSLLLAGLVHIVVVYTVGVIYFYLISRFYLGNIPTARTLLMSCCLVFIPGDAVSVFLGALLAKRLRPILKLNALAG